MERVKRVIKDYVRLKEEESAPRLVMIEDDDADEGKEEDDDVDEAKQRIQHNETKQEDLKSELCERCQKCTP